MQDVLIKQTTDGLYDIQIEGSDFASAEGFESALPVSYFTDARAPSTYVQEAQNRRGWVGNILTAEQQRELGSLLWILDQARLTEDTINFGQVYAEGGLRWMIEDDIVKTFTILVERVDKRIINIYTDVTTINNEVQRYVTLWKNTDFTRILS